MGLADFPIQDHEICFISLVPIRSMKSGGVWKTRSRLVYKWSVLQLATFPWLYKSQYCVAVSIANRYTIPSFLLQQKKVWLAVHVMTIYFSRH